MVIAISIIWVIIRAICSVRAKRFDWKRELQLLLVYICIVVVVRFTFCPFGKVICYFRYGPFRDGYKALLATLTLYFDESFL